MRVNARFEGVAEQQLEYLTHATSASVSEVLRLSVENYYQQLRGSQPTLKNFGRHVGAHRSGQTDASANYKTVVAEAIAARHALPPAATK